MIPDSGRLVDDAHVHGVNQNADTGDIGRQMNLRRSIEAGHLSEVRELLAAKASAIASDARQQVPLHWASRQGRPEIALLLLEYKANPKVGDRHGQAPLHLASRFGHDEVLQTLLSHSERNGDEWLRTFLVNQTMHDGRTGLHLAAQNGHASTVNILLDSNADAQAEDLLMERTPVEYALTCNVAATFMDRNLMQLSASNAVFATMRNGRLEVVELLAGFDVPMSKREWEERVLAKGQELQELVWQKQHNVVLADRLPRIQELIVGPDNKHVLEFRQPDTPVLRAVWDHYGLFAGRGDLSMVHILLSLKANVEAKTEFGETSLMVSVRERDDATMVQLLIGFGADVRSTAQNGFSVLHWVAAHGRKKCARSLSDHSHFVDGVVQISDTGFTPQMIAWHRNHKEVARVFRDAEPPHRAPLTVGALVKLKNDDPDGFEIAISPNRFFLHENLDTGETIPKLQWDALQEFSNCMLLLFQQSSRFELVDDLVRRQLLFRIVKISTGPKLHQSNMTRWTIIDNRAPYRTNWQATLEKSAGKLSEEVRREYARLCQEQSGKILTKKPMKQLFCTEDQDAILRQDTFHDDIPGLNDADLSTLVHWLMERDVFSAAGLIDLVQDEHFSTLSKFWANIYKRILLHFAQKVDESFHESVRKHLGMYGEDWSAAPGKKFERILVKELEYGVVGAESYEERTVASRILDFNRGSLTVKDPAEMLKVMKIIESWTLEETSMLPVLGKNGFSEQSFTDYRDMKYIVLFRPPSPGGEPSWPVLCELQLLLPQWIKLKKALHPLYRIMRGDYCQIDGRALWLAWKSMLPSGDPMVIYLRPLARDIVLTSLDIDSKLIQAAEQALGMSPSLTHWTYAEFHALICMLPWSQLVALCTRLIETFVRD